MSASPDTPAVPPSTTDRTRVAGEQPQPDDAPRPRRHRMAGSHDGMYITEHHRGAKKP